MKPSAGSCGTADIFPGRIGRVGMLAGMLMLAGSSYASPPLVLSSVSGGLGGGTAAAGVYTVHDTTGQPSVGAAASEDYGLETGFWPTVHDMIRPGVPVAWPLTNGPTAFPEDVLLAGCVDPEGNPLTLAAVDPVSSQGGTLTHSNGWVYYFPPNGLTSTDTFHYLVQSAVGDQLAATMEMTKVNLPPLLAHIPELTGYAQSVLNFTIVATDADQPLVFGLGADTPPGVLLDPSTGLFAWVPTRAHARTTNVFTVWVKDSGLPPAFTTNTITVVVGDYMALGLGQTVVRTGETNQVSVELDTSSGLTRVSALAHLPDSRLSPLALTEWAQEVDTATLQPVATDWWRLEFTARTGQCFQGTQTLGQLAFAAVADRPSAFVPLEISEPANLQTNGLPTVHTIAENGRVVIVGGEPLLEALPPNQGRPHLVLYGPPATYRIEAATNAAPTGGWEPVWEGTIPADAWWVFPNLSATPLKPLHLFRAQKRSLNDAD